MNFSGKSLPEYPPELNASEHPLPESDEQENTQEQAAPSGDAESSASGSQSYGASFDPSFFFSALLKQLYIDQQYVPRTVYIPVDFADRDYAGGLAERTRTAQGRDVRAPAGREALPGGPGRAECQAEF